MNATRSNQTLLAIIAACATIIMLLLLFFGLTSFNQAAKQNGKEIAACINNGGTYQSCR